MEKLSDDEVSKLITGWGKFQICALIVLGCAFAFSSFQLSYIFVARDTNYRCKIQSCDNDFGEYNPEWLENAVPFEDDTPSLCLYYKPKYNNTCTEFYKNETLVCSDFVFQINQTTIVQDFNITCDENLWKLTLAGTVNGIGAICGLLVFGYFSDRFGRKRILIISLSLSTIMGLVRSFSPWYYFYIVLEFLDPLLASGVYSGSIILALEMTETKRRSAVNCVMNIFYTIGEVILGIAAWFSPSWRILLRFIYGSGVVITLLLWLLPESIQWLLSKNRVKEATRTLNFISKFNTGLALNEDTIDSLTFNQMEDEKHEETKTCTKIIKSRVLLLRILNCSYAWLSGCFAYYGLTMQSVTLSENVYADYIYTTLVEIPSYLVLQIVMDRIGRKKTLGFSAILTGISCIFVNVLEKPYWATLVIFLCGKFFTTMANATIPIYTVEMFPTKLRHSVFAFCSIFGNVGIMLAPQLPLLERLFTSLPIFVIAGVAITSGVFSFFFPETLNADLPDEIEQAINLDVDSTNE